MYVSGGIGANFKSKAMSELDLPNGQQIMLQKCTIRFAEAHSV